MFTPVSITVLSLILPVLSSDPSFKWEDCSQDMNERVMIVNRVDVQPQPITIRKLTHLNITVDIDLTENLNQDFQFRVKVKRVAFGWGVPVLSLKMSVCAWLTSRIFSPLTCPIYKAATGETECKCPVLKRNYAAKNATITVDLDKLPVPKIFYKLGAGNYELEISGWNGNGKQSGCVKVSTPVKVQI